LLRWNVLETNVVQETQTPFKKMLLKETNP